MNLIFLATCERCKIEKTSDNFGVGGKEKFCDSCRNKWLCDICGERSRWGYETDLVGKKCGVHKESDMVNLSRGEYPKNQFIMRIIALGGKVLGEYKGKSIPVKCVCNNGHLCNPRPTIIQSNGGMCRVCIQKDPETSKQNFINRIIELGGKVLGEYTKSNVPVRCICKNEHLCNPIPSGIQQGSGMCKICAGMDFNTSKQNFINRIIELGGKVLGEYKGNHISVNCLCKYNHLCCPAPSSLQQGQGMCSKCYQSCGEMLTEQTLKQLCLEYISQDKHPSIKSLRYDYSIIFKNKLYYIEYHGAQHEKFTKHFHKTIDDFNRRRQLDILKVYVAKKNNIHMIILDHTWSKKPLETWVKYFRDCFERKDELIIADSPLHSWIHNDEPSQEIKDEFGVE